MLSIALACPFAAFPQAAPPVWGPSANLFGTITTYGVEASGPAIDGQGNGYVVLNTYDSYGGTDTVSIVKSAGTSGAWNAPQVIYTIPSSELAQCDPVVADTAGNVTVFCTEIARSNGFTQVVALRYNATAGWLAPVTVYQGLQPYNVLPVTDANGDIVLVLGIPFSANAGATCYIYSAAAQQWLPPVGIAPLTNKGVALDYTLRANRAGTAIFFVYLDQLGYTTSLYGQRFDVPTLTWEKAQLIPGSAGKNNQISPAGNAQFPLAVDSSGAASIFFNLAGQGRYDGDVRVSRYENGSWGPAAELVRSRNTSFELLYYGAADAGATETAAAALGFSSSGLITQYFFDYDGSKWTTSTLEQYQATNSGPYLAFSFTGTDNTSVLAYSGPNNQPLAIRNDGTGWSTPAPMPLGVRGVLATSSTGQTVLESSQTDGYNTYNFFGSWLQN
jgi:hypothetical protein